MSDGNENIKKFFFGKTKCNSNNSEHTDKLEVLIPELLQAGYSFYTWPCSPILAWFLWERRNHLQHKRVLEIGSGTSLPGILAAKCGAQVTLSDCNQLPKTLAHIKKCCLLNNLTPGLDIQVVGITWGLLLNNIFTLGELDLIIASDCFYDPSVFEDILVTVSFLLEANRHCKFIFTYQERSTDWAIEALLKKWDLKCVNINLDSLGIDCGIDVRDLMGGHTINLFEISHR